MLRYALIALTLATAVPAAADIQVRRADTTRPGSLIVVTGRINEGDDARFMEAAHDNRVVGVEFNSEGGDLLVAMQIGSLIREQFLPTFVATDQSCASACVVAFAAGVERVVNGRLGLHRPHFAAAAFARLSPSQAKSRYDEMVEEFHRYWIWAGATEQSFGIMMSTGSDAIRWVDRDEAVRLGLQGEDPAWGEYYRALEQANAIPRRR